MSLIETTYRICLLGGGGTGKSSFITRLIHNKFEEEILDPTLTEEYSFEVSYKKKSMRIILIDTPGQEQYQELRKECISKSDGFFVFYDITSRLSFEEASQLCSQVIVVKDYFSADECIPIILLGSKCDIPGSHRQVLPSEGQNLAKQYNCPFFEVSNKTSNTESLNSNQHQYLMSLLEQLEFRTKKKKKMTQSAKSALKKQFKELDSKEKKEQKEKAKLEKKLREQEKSRNFEAFLQKSRGDPSPSARCRASVDRPSSESASPGSTRYPWRSGSQITPTSSNIIMRLSHPQQSFTHVPTPPPHPNPETLLSGINSLQLSSDDTNESNEDLENISPKERSRTEVEDPFQSGVISAFDSPSNSSPIPNVSLQNFAPPPKSINSTTTTTTTTSTSSPSSIKSESTSSLEISNPGPLLVKSPPSSPTLNRSPRKNHIFNTIHDRKHIKCFNHVHGRDDDCIKIPIDYLKSFDSLHEDIFSNFSELKPVQNYLFLSYQDRDNHKVRILKRTDIQEIKNEAISLHIFSKDSDGLRSLIQQNEPTSQPSDLNDSQQQQQQQQQHQQQQENDK